jgi:type I restriction enzyme, R subunit
LTKLSSMCGPMAGGFEPRERVIKGALFDILKDVAKVERIFPIVKAQNEY